MEGWTLIDIQINTVEVAKKQESCAHRLHQPQKSGPALLLEIYKKVAPILSRNVTPSLIYMLQIFQSMLRDDLMEHMLSNKLLRDCQHGLMSKKS